MAYDILVPLMTSATTPSGVVSSSSVLAGYPAYQVFDRSTSTIWSAASAVVFPEWISYQFANPQTVYEYSITPWNGYTDRAPKDFKLQGSNSGSSWTDLDTRTGVAMTFQKYTYTLAAPATYMYFRLVVTAINTSIYLAISEVELAGYSQPAPACYLHERKNRLDTQGVSFQNLPYYAYTGPGWTTTWTKNFATQNSLGAYSFRTVLLPADLSTSGNNVRITIKSSTAGNIIVTAASIVERLSGANGTTTPTQFFFLGSSGITVPTGSEVSSDVLSYAIDETKAYIVTVDIASGYTLYGDTGEFYYKASASSYNQQTVSGFTSNSFGGQSMYKVEVY